MYKWDFDIECWHISVTILNRWIVVKDYAWTRLESLPIIRGQTTIESGIVVRKSFRELRITRRQDHFYAFADRQIEPVSFATEFFSQSISDRTLFIHLLPFLPFIICVTIFSTIPTETHPEVHFVIMTATTSLNDHRARSLLSSRV